MDRPRKKGQPEPPPGGGAAGRQEQFNKQRGLKPKKADDQAGKSSAQGAAEGPADRPQSDKSKEEE